MSTGRQLLERLDRALFDDESPQLDRFGLLLAVIVGTLVVLSLVDIDQSGDTSSDVGALLVTLFISAMLMLAMRASGVARRWRRVVDVIAVLGVVVSAVILLLDLGGGSARSDGGAPRPSLIWLILLVAIPIVIVRRILTHRRVRLATLLGAISAYLLIAFSFAFAFLAVGSYQSGDFFGRPEPTTSFMYFSLTSITTVGYGDLTATTNLGRLLATSEAVTGQIFLVTLVAALVGSFARRTPSEDPADA